VKSGGEEIEHERLREKALESGSARARIVSWLHHSITPPLHPLPLMFIFDQLRKNDPQLRLLAGGIVCGFAILACGLWWIQIVRARDFQASMETQHFRTVRVPALRGMILDRNGKILADNRPSFDVSLFLEDLPPLFQEEYKRIRPRTIVTNNPPFWKFWAHSGVVTQSVKLTRAGRDGLTWQARYNVVSNATMEVSRRLQQPAVLQFAQFQKHFIENLPLPMTVVRDLNVPQVARFVESLANQPGVDIEIRTTRVYPYESTAAHLLGYLRRDNDSVESEEAYYSYRLPDRRGVVGVEGGLDAYLRGRAGLKSVLINSLGFRKEETIWSPVQPGSNVTLTLDVELQQAVESSLRKRIERDKGAAVVVMDVNSGEVLAMASSPSGNPNDFIRGFSGPEQWARWTNASLGLQKNRATRENYQAGSIFKPIIALAALENGLNPQEEIIVEANKRNPNRGIIYVGRNREPVDDTAPPGPYNLKRAIVRSSNAYFVEVGLRPGVLAHIVEFGRQLHLGERFGPETLPLLQETPGTFPDAQRVSRSWAPGDTANICIGQGEVDVTPLQMAVMTSALANGGKVLWPRLVSRIDPADSTSGDQGKTFAAGRVRDQLGVSANHLRLVRDAMLAETEDAEGTGTSAAMPGLRICGKTGTAERTERGQKLNTVWFISYAPAENPKHAVVVMAENGISGGKTCAPVAHDVYSAILRLEGTRAGGAIAANP
jgi:penicillin-binding protein 2